MIRPLLIVYMLCGTASVWADTPISGRTQQMLFSRTEVQAAAASAYREQLKLLSATGELDTDQQTLQRVRHISARLITQAIHLKPESSSWPWEIHLTSDSHVSAFSMAGGKLLIGSHFISGYRLSDDELAVALAHEIGHVIAEHVREQLSQAAIFDPPPPNRKQHVEDVINAMETDIAVYLRLQPLSQLQELEADDIGIELAARAGIPAKSIKSFYDKITADANGQSIFNTHGSSKQRSTFVQSMVAYAKMNNRTGPGRQIPIYIFH